MSIFFQIKQKINIVNEDEFFPLTAFQRIIEQFRENDIQTITIGGEEDNDSGWGVAFATNTNVCSLEELQRTLREWESILNLNPKLTKVNPLDN